MILSVDAIHVGRDEIETDDNRLWIEVERDFAPLVERVLLQREPGARRAYENWNVFGLMGPVGRWRSFEWQTWEGLGRLTAPVLRTVIRYDRSSGEVELVRLSGPDVPVMHGSSRLLGPLPSDASAVSLAVRQRLLWVERRIEERSLLGHPWANTRRSWAVLAARENLPEDCEKGVEERLRAQVKEPTWTEDDRRRERERVSRRMAELGRQAHKKPASETPVPAVSAVPAVPIEAIVPTDSEPAAPSRVRELLARRKGTLGAIP